MPVGVRYRTALVALAVTATVLSGVGQRQALAAPSQLNGSAYGAFVKVGLFGGEPNQVGAAPVVVLPTAGGSDTESLPKIIAQFGPATIFGGQYVEPGRNPSGVLTVSTKGKTGPGGFVTSSASVVNIGPGPLIVDKMSSTCTANEAGVSGSTTLTKGVLETKYDTESQEATVTVPIPESPAPNTAFEGTIDHVGDRFRMVFNEQIVSGDTITVRAAHMYLLGNIAVGDMIVGQSVCGLSPDDGSTTPPTTKPEAAASPTTESEGKVSPSTALSAASTDEESGGGASLLVGVLSVAGGLGLATLVVIRRRKHRRA